MHLRYRKWINIPDLLPDLSTAFLAFFSPGPFPTIFAGFLTTNKWKYKTSENLNTGKRGKFNTVLDIQSDFDLLRLREAITFTFFLLNSNILRTVFLKKGNLTNLLLVFEMADFKFSLSWSLCFWEQTPLIVLWSMWIGNTKINKSRFWKILYYYGINLYYYGFNLQCVSFRPTPGGAFPNTYLFRDGRRETSTTSQSLIHTQE